MTQSGVSPSHDQITNFPLEVVKAKIIGELILFQNIGYTHAEWTFRDRTGKWSAQGHLKWPWGAEYDKHEPIRVCYPNVALRGRSEAVEMFEIPEDG